MVSAENGATTLSAIVTPQITPVGNGAPGENYTEHNKIESSSQFDAGEYGPTTIGGGTVVVPSNPSVIVTYFKMRGFYVTGSVYENWVVNSAPSFTPPSGHTLINIIIAATWQSS
jgi:hypothetical protein